MFLKIVQEDKIFRKKKCFDSILTCFRHKLISNVVVTAENTELNKSRYEIAKVQYDSPKSVSKFDKTHSHIEKNIFNAARSGDIESIKYLIEHDHVDVETKELSKGETPLHCAIANNKIEIACYLIETCKANVEARDKDGWTPLHYAEFNKQKQIVTHLINRWHANTKATNNEGLTPYQNSLRRASIKRVF